MAHGFDALPEALRPIAKPRVYEPHVHPVPHPPDEALVDCGVYVDGERLPGKFTYADACSKVHEIELTAQERQEGQEGEEGEEAQERQHAFVWVGLHEPDESQMQDVADVFGLHPLAVEDAVHAHQRPKLGATTTRCFLS